MKIGIIVGSTRDNRVGRTIGDWVLEQAQGRETTYELVDLADFDVPMLSSAVPPAALNREYADPAVTAWGRKLDEFDGFVFVTPEYNHGVPGAMKNAVDQVGPELMKKAVAFVGYGANGGIRAVENWRVILANFNMYDIRNALDINIFTEMAEGALKPADRRAEEATELFETLEAASAAMATLR